MGVAKGMDAYQSGCVFSTVRPCLKRRHAGIYGGQQLVRYNGRGTMLKLQWLKLQLSCGRLVVHWL